MRLLVTGATGFIGSHLCHALADGGHSVTALVRNPAKAAKLPEGVEILEGDLSLFSQPDVVLAEQDVVVHLAGVVAAENVADYEAVNFRAVVDLADCLERQSWRPMRLVFASSLAAAGPSPPGRAWTEEDELAPIEPYGEAKARAEQALAGAPFPVTNFRPPPVFGAGDPATLTLFKSARSGIGMRAYGEAQRLSFVDVRDLCRAIIAMCEDERAGGFTYFVCHRDTADTKTLWASLGAAFGRRVTVVSLPRPVLWLAMKVSTFGSALFGYTNQLDEKQYRQIAAPAFVCSAEALRKDLGWEARHDLDESLRDALDGYRALGML
jgi:dihydroflavonol-4-reductase